MRANEPLQERLAEKYLMSLVVDLSARTGTRKAKATRQCRSKDPLTTRTLWRLPARKPRTMSWMAGKPNNRRSAIYFLTDPMYQFSPAGATAPNCCLRISRAMTEEGSRSTEDEWI